jgi:hypothetical protein
MRGLRTLFLLSHSHSAMNGVKIEVRCDPSQVEKDLIFNSLAEFNESQVGDARFKEFGIFAYCRFQLIRRLAIDGLSSESTIC